MKIRKNVLKSLLIRWTVVLIALFLIILIPLFRARPIVISYAKSHAKSLMISAFDEAVKNTISNLDYKYSDMAVVTRTADNMVSSIEIDYQKLNILRSEISAEISKVASNNSTTVLRIPVGTLLGNEYTTGYGPAVKFKITYSHMPVLDFISNFSSAGINSVFHQIIIKANLSCSIIMLGADQSFSVEMTAVAAQTIISGAVPDSFTNVTETPGSNVADEIFNYSQK